MGDSSAPYPSRWSGYIQCHKTPIYDPRGDVQLVLSKRITPSAISPNTGTGPTKKVQDGGEAQLEAPAGQNNGASPAEAPTAHENQEIEAKVSSKHLSLASKVFRAMFDGNFREGVALGADQATKVPLPEDNADAMMVLLGIIHGLNRSVPRKIEYALFFAIVVLIDKYELQEATGVYTDLWFSDLWPARNTLTPHLADRIYTCWVLRRPVEYTEVTRDAIYWCTSHFEENGLPFPPAIPTSRLSIIGDMLIYLNDTVERYQSDTQQCLRHAECDALVLGDLIKKLKLKGLYPIPQATALDISIMELFSRLRALGVSSLCEIYPLTQLKPSRCIPKLDLRFCGVMKGLESELSKLEKRIQGLTLPFFTP
ncbi:hypothetical protein CLAIMM_11721 [Cladophialophora immunda]|nr:hypothetical protein CLAIMM_11721 [Cladophialophora immunda]